MEILIFFHNNCVLKYLANENGYCTFATDLVSGITTGIKREVRCKSGAIPVAVRRVNVE